MGKIRGILSHSIPILVAFFLPLSFYLLTTFILPRPYYISWHDLESGYYYGSRLAFFRIPVVDISHPGTPILYFGSLFFSVTGSAFARTQAFFNIGYFVAAFFLIFSLSLFTTKILHGIPIGVALLAVFACFYLPPVLTHLNIFGSDSFLFSFSLSTVTIFWIALGSSHPKQMLALFCTTGAGIGLCLATKLSFLPVAFIIVLVSWLQITLTSLPLKIKLALYICLPLTSIVSFLLFTFPIFNRLPEVLLHLINRSDILPSNGPFFLSFLSLFDQEYLLPLFIFELLIALSFVFVVLKVLMNILKNFKQSHLFVEKFLKSVFLTFLLASYCYSLTTLKPDYDPGVVLRNTLSTSVFFPFAIVYLYYYFLTETPVLSRIKNLGLVIAGCVLLCISILGFLHLRQEFIVTRVKLVTTTENYIVKYLKPGFRMAIWDGSPGFLLGEQAFHFWGNYAYAYDKFDGELLPQFPNYSFFKLRQVRTILRQNEPGYQQPVGNPKGILGLWQRVFPSPWTGRNDEIVTGENEQVKVAVIAFPTRELLELQNNSFDSLIQLVRARFGKVDVVEQNIQGIPWTIIILDEAGIK